MEDPKGRETDYTLNENLADKAIQHIHQEKSATPDRPFFIHYAPDATYAPHHVPESWIAKFRGQFDQRWDKYREETGGWPFNDAGSGPAIFGEAHGAIATFNTPSR